jgi:hypothetical protein
MKAEWEQEHPNTVQGMWQRIGEKLGRPGIHCMTLWDRHLHKKEIHNDENANNDGI